MTSVFPPSHSFSFLFLELSRAGFRILSEIVLLLLRLITCLFLFLGYFPFRIVLFIRILALSGVALLTVHTLLLTGWRNSDVHKSLAVFVDLSLPCLFIELVSDGYWRIEGCCLVE